MRQLLLALILLMAFPAFAGERINLYDGRVAFVLPDGFSRMSDEMADKKYRRESRPAHIYSDAKTTTSIAVALAEAEVALEQLGEFKSFMEQTYTRMIPGAQWVKRDFITIANTRWARLELMSNALDTDIHNIVLITILDKKPLMLNFNSTKGEFSRLEKALLKSIDTIRIKQNP